jgi:hypothetical protein
VLGQRWATCSVKSMLGAGRAHACLCSTVCMATTGSGCSWHDVVSCRHDTLQCSDLLHWQLLQCPCTVQLHFWHYCVRKQPQHQVHGGCVGAAGAAD